MNVHIPISRYAQAALMRECAEVARTTSGRNARLNAAAFAMGQLVGAGLISEGEVVEALLLAAEACGYIGKDGRAAALATIRSGLRRGALDPRDPPARDHRGNGTVGQALPDPEELARQEHAREQLRVAREAEAQIKAERVRRIWDEADPDPRGKLPERYLTEHRRLELLASVCGHAVRWHQRCPWEGERVPAMLCAYRDLITNAVVGLHRTRLDPVTAAKVDRMALGRVKGAAIKLTPDDEVTAGLHVAEGLETALTGMMMGLTPMWALGWDGGVAALPALSGIEALTLLAENDANGANQRACGQAAERWHRAGRLVDIIVPRIGKDLNDAIRAEIVA